MNILAGLLAGAALMQVFSLPVNAFTTVESSSGATTVTVVNAGSEDANGVVEIVTYSGPVDNFSINLATDLSLHDINYPYVDLNTVDFSGASSSLKFRLYDTGYSTSSPVDFAFNVGGIKLGTISYAGFYYLGNELFGTTNSIGSDSLTGPGSFADNFSSGAISPASPLSRTEIITHSGGNNNNGFDSDNIITPKPGTILLLGTGLLGLAIYGRRRMKA